VVTQNKTTIDAKKSQVYSATSEGDMIIHAGGRDLSEKAEGEEYGSDFEVAANQLSQIVKGATEIN
jgi:hypothetical protein